ncbi:MAG: LamG-like jellyroll fold domain-containing protein [Bacteriovoracaceae bacterium]
MSRQKCWRTSVEHKKHFPTKTLSHKKLSFTTQRVDKIDVTSLFNMRRFMKKQKFTTLILLLLSFIISGCNEEEVVVQEIVTEVPTNPDEPGEVTDPIRTDYSGLISDHQFLGVQDVTDITQREAKIRWDKANDMAVYSVFLKTPEQTKFIGQTKRDNLSIRNLKANTNYQVFVKALDHLGKIDKNQKKISFLTPEWPEFNNNVSLNFAGNNWIQLGKSNEMIKSKSFSVSLWFKTAKNQSNKRIITFHRGQSSGTGFNLMFENDTLTLGYRDEQDAFHKLSHNVVYSDDRWHHVVGTYNKKKFVLYFDGVKASEARDTFRGFGDQTAYIGTYDSNQLHIDASLDEISIWKKALNRRDVEAIYNNGSSFDLAQHSRYRSITHWWRFGDLAGDDETTLTDVYSDTTYPLSGFSAGDFSNDAP